MIINVIIRLSLLGRAACIVQAAGDACRSDEVSLFSTPRKNVIFMCGLFIF